MGMELLIAALLGGLVGAVLMWLLGRARTAGLDARISLNQEQLVTAEKEIAQLRNSNT